MTTFGDRRSATAASAFVSRLHERVQGTYVHALGVERSYAANDEVLLRWVHDAFTEAFIRADEMFAGRSPATLTYVREWRRRAASWACRTCPRSVAARHDEMATFLVEAKPDERVAAAELSIRRPGLPGLTGRPDPIPFGGAARLA